MCSRLFLWLYEYLERLEQGVYVVAPTDMMISLSAHWNNPANCRRISLFPRPHACGIPRPFDHNQDHGDCDSQNHSNSNSRSITDMANKFSLVRQQTRYRPLIDSIASTVSVCVTDGIQVTASSLFLIERSRVT